MVSCALPVNILCSTAAARRNNYYIVFTQNCGVAKNVELRSQFSINKLAFFTLEMCFLPSLLGSSVFSVKHTEPGTSLQNQNPHYRADEKRFTWATVHFRV